MKRNVPGVQRLAHPNGKVQKKICFDNRSLDPGTKDRDRNSKM